MLFITIGLYMVGFINQATFTQIAIDYERKLGNEVDWGVDDIIYVFIWPVFVVLYVLRGILGALPGATVKK